MLVFNQFDLTVEETPVFLSGQLMEDSEIYRLLVRYVKKLQFLDPPAFFQYGTKLAHHPKYLYFDLLCLLLCK